METPRHNAEPAPDEQTGAGTSGGGPAAARTPDSAEGQAIPLGALPTSDLLVWFLGVLAAKAWEGMGLVPNPGTGKIDKNLDGARMAIDAYAAILDAARERLESAPRREMETLLTTLRLNFVEKSAGGGPAEGA